MPNGDTSMTYPFPYKTQDGVDGFEFNSVFINNGTYLIDLSAKFVTSSYYWYYPAGPGTIGQVLTSGGGIEGMYWSPAPISTITGPANLGITISPTTNSASINPLVTGAGNFVLSVSPDLTTPTIYTNLELSNTTYAVTLSPNYATQNYSWFYPATPGTAGQLLVSGGGVNTMAWVTVGSGGIGTVSYVGLSLPSFLSVTPSAITSSGTFSVSLSGTPLPPSSGGTGLSSIGAGPATVLTSNGTSLSWQVPATGTVTSVGMVVPSFLSVSPSTITGSGTFTITDPGATGSGGVVLQTAPYITNLNVTGNIDASPSYTGSLIVTGGLSMNRNFFVEGNFNDTINTGLTPVWGANIMAAPTITAPHPVTYAIISTLQIRGAPIAGTDVTIDVGYGLEALGGIYTDDITVTGAIDVAGDFGVLGVSTFTGAVVADGPVSVAGLLDATGAVTIGGDLSVAGVTDVVGTLTTTGNTIVGGILTVTGATDLNGALAVNGISNLTGNVSIEGTLEVVGATTLAALTAGESNVGVLISYSLSTGNINAAALVVAGVSTLNGAVNVAGALTAEGALNVTGVLAAEGNLNVAGTFTAEGAANVVGLLSAEGAMNVTGAFTAEGAANVTGLLSAEGDLNVAGALTVEGESNFTGLVTVEGGMNVAGLLAAEGDVTVGGLFGVTGAATFTGLTSSSISCGGLTVDGNITFQYGIAALFQIQNVGSTKIFGVDGYGNIYSSSTQNTTSTNAALIISGGANIYKDLWVGQNFYLGANIGTGVYTEIQSAVTIAANSYSIVFPSSFGPAGSFLQSLGKNATMQWVANTGSGAVVQSINPIFSPPSSSTTSPALTIQNYSGSPYNIGINPFYVSASYSLYLPATLGSVGTLLTSGGATGALTWSTTTGSGSVVALQTGPTFLAPTGASTTPNLQLTNFVGTYSVSLSTYGIGANYNWVYPNSAGTAGQVLASGGGGASPMTWVSAAGGSVTSVALTTPSFLTVSGSPITSSGTLAISYSGTALPVLNGGTGVTTSTGSQSNVLQNGAQMYNLYVTDTSPSSTSYAIQVQGNGALTYSQTQGMLEVTYPGSVPGNMVSVFAPALGSGNAMTRTFGRSAATNMCLVEGFNYNSLSSGILNTYVMQLYGASASIVLGTGGTSITGGPLTLGTPLTYGSGGTGLATLGSAGQVLTIVSGAPAWATPSAPGTGTVTSVAATVPAFLSVAGSPVTSSGTLAISYSGTALPTANGGTGSTAASTGTGGVVLQNSSLQYNTQFTDITGSSSSYAALVTGNGAITYGQTQGMLEVSYPGSVPGNMVSVFAPALGSGNTMTRTFGRGAATNQCLIESFYYNSTTSGILDTYTMQLSGATASIVLGTGGTTFTGVVNAPTVYALSVDNITNSNGLYIGYNTPKGTGAQTVLAVYDNATDHFNLINAISKGSSTGADQVRVMNDTTTFTGNNTYTSGNLPGPNNNVWWNQSGGGAEMCFGQALNTGAGNAAFSFFNNTLTNMFTINNNSSTVINAPSAAQATALTLTHASSASSTVSTTCPLNIVSAAGSNNYCIAFNFPGSTTLVGNVTTSSVLTTYNTTSDYRLKENIRPIARAVARVMALKPVKYNFIANPAEGRFMGFLAHELQEVIPAAVTGVKDGEEIQAVDYGKLTPLLTAAIQEQQDQIREHQDQIQALLQRIVELENKQV